MSFLKFLHKTIASTAIVTTAILISLSDKAALAVGLTTSQGDKVMNADVARNRFGVDGTGVTIGVMTDSFNNLGGAESDVANGDLPFGINVLQDLLSGGDDEGRGMLQIIHDVAPGAKLLFRTAYQGEADYAKGILELADAGANIIVSDVLYFTEPMFQDGIVAQAVNQVVSRPGTSSVSYFAAASNENRRAYESAFNPSGVFEPTFNGEFHNFDSGSGVDIFQSITLPPGANLAISLQWDEPFRSVSGGNGAAKDLDIFLYDSYGTNILAASTESNLGQDPIEIFGFTNDSETSEFNLAIANKSGSAPDLMKYVVFGGGRSFKINEFDTASGSLFGNANANGAQAVGAAFYAETPEFAIDPARLRFFSSAGGTPILFDPDGNRLASPEIRNKPEIVAPDGVNTSFFGSDIAEDIDDFPNFPGTSAAAPHAAAVAALMLQLNPSLSPKEIYAILQETALDMDDPSTSGFDVGFDFASGYGLIQADRALAAVAIPEPPSTLAMLAFSALGVISLLKRKLKET